jgi:transcriptional regulator of acetoin/glycerol metabolism
LSGAQPSGSPQFAHAAARLGMKKSTLYFRLRKPGISLLSDDQLLA